MSKAEEVLPFLADPERRAEDERRQEMRRASFSRARLSDAERMVARGARIEGAAREAMKLPRSRGENREQHLRQLAHGLALQGRFAEAAEVAPDGPTAEHYAAVHDAIRRPDALCGCARKEVQDPLSGQTLEISPRRHLKDVYSPAHGGVVALMGCECGHLNARPLAGQAREIASNAAASHKATDARQVRKDAHVLGKRR